MSHEDPDRPAETRRSLLRWSADKLHPRPEGEITRGAYSEVQRIWTAVRRIIAALLLLTVGFGMGALLTYLRAAAVNSRLHDVACIALKYTPPQTDFHHDLAQLYPDCPAYQTPAPHPVPSHHHHNKPSSEPLRSPVARENPRGSTTTAPGATRTQTATVATTAPGQTVTVTRTASGRTISRTITVTRTTTAPAIPGLICGVLGRCRSR